MKLPGDWAFELSVNTDGRKPVSLSVGTWGNVKDDDAGGANSYWSTLTWRPTTALKVSINPSYARSRNELQFVTTAGDAEARYVFGKMDRETFDLSFRIDWALTPTLTVQYYGAPFVSAGDYSDFKRITAPRADAFGDRFTGLGEALHYDEENGQYRVDEDGDSIDEYAFDDPDFNIRDFNSNLVLRWEYSPGSSLYLVWQQSRFGYDPTGRFALQDDLDGLFEVHPHNVFLIKVSRWFNI